DARRRGGARWGRGRGRGGQGAPPGSGGGLGGRGPPWPQRRCFTSPVNEPPRSRKVTTPSRPSLPAGYELRVYGDVAPHKRHRTAGSGAVSRGQVHPA